jgi:hypothetical protein
MAYLPAYSLLTTKVSFPCGLMLQLRSLTLAYQMEQVFGNTKEAATLQQLACAASGSGGAFLSTALSFALNHSLSSMDFCGSQSRLHTVWFILLYKYLQSNSH